MRFIYPVHGAVTMSEIQGNYDYIIVGGGSAGAVLATRLSENPALDILLIEAGAKDTNPMIHIPFGISLLSRFEAAAAL